MLENRITFCNEVSIEELDNFAWQAICDWPTYADIDVMHEGLDNSHLTRYFLWDKVGRAIRKKYFPNNFKFEETLLDRTWGIINSLSLPLISSRLLSKRFVLSTNGDPMKAEEFMLIYTSLQFYSYQ
jgi:hypothetical protein